MRFYPIRTAHAATALLLLLGAGVPYTVCAQTQTTGAVATDRYPNLLGQRGHSEKEIDARVAATFQQLFHGDGKTQALLYESGQNANGPLAYITDVANHDARTEGMSYGMMLAVQTGHKAEFDAIWNWAKTYMLITDPHNPSVGYFAWSMNVDGTPRSDSPAPDGEQYFVMSLYFAAHRWGSGTGIYNYQAEADQLLHLMRHHPVLTGTPPFRIHPEDPPFEPRSHPDPAAHPTPNAITVGPMVNEPNTMMVFVPNSGANTFTDPSYHLPAFYELWARWGPAEDRAFWAAAARRSRRFFVQATGPRTGLSSDYANFDGTPRATSFNPMSGNFSYDSWRTIGNWSVDQAWWGANAEARVLSDRMQHFLFAEGIKSFADQYTQAGQALSHRHSTGMLAQTAVGGLAATPGATADAFLDELWATPTPSGEQRYYNGMLYFFALLETSGRYRAWMPHAPK